MFKLPSEKEALNLLRKAGCSNEVIKHCKAVAKLATKLAQKIEQKGVIVDIDLVKIGSLLHDLGRAKTHNIEHAIIGAKLAESFNLPESITQIIERHIGAGITAEDAKKLGLPKKSFLPRTLEEKIVAYSDKLIEKGLKIGFKEALQIFSKELGAFLGPKSIKRLEELHNEILTIMDS